MEDTLRDFECTLAFHGAPSLAGIKPADLIAWGSPQVCMGTLLEDYRCQLSRCGIQLRLLCSCRPRCLILVYRPERLAAQLAHPQVQSLLAAGKAAALLTVQCFRRYERCRAALCRRVKEGESLPRLFRAA